MKVRMLKNHEAALDGANVVKLKRGEKVEVPERFVENWTDKKIAEEDKAKEKPKETKVVSAKEEK